MAIRSRISEKTNVYWFGAIRTGLICCVAAFAIGLIVLKVVPYIALFSGWPHHVRIAGYAAKILLPLSLLLIINEIIITRHPHYDVWLLAALGGIIGVLAW